MNVYHPVMSLIDRHWVETRLLDGEERRILVVWATAFVVGTDVEKRTLQLMREVDELRAATALLFPPYKVEVHLPPATLGLGSRRARK
jgi:hypothetical protein